ncbi:MAG: hypothetical protein IH595_06135 [Bacteroidales bacterium]|nr:hypothetical protein [Bacteroidales bacterium]
MNANKPRIVKDFDKLDVEIQEQVKLAYPDGFFQHLVSYMDRDGNKVSALPFETTDKYYLTRMSKQTAIELIEEDDDYDSDGSLKEDIRLDYEDKYGGEPDFIDEIKDELNTDSDDDGDDDSDL